MLIRGLTTGLLACCLAAMSTASSADSELGAYFVELGPEDFFNSRGVRLTDGGAIFQQDRANYHRFGVRHGGDSSDPYFSTRDLRAAIPSLFTHPNDRQWLADIARMDPQRAARPGYADYRVLICGSGGRMTRLLLDFADGDAYSSC